MKPILQTYSDYPVKVWSSRLEIATRVFVGEALVSWSYYKDTSRLQEIVDVSIERFNFLPRDIHLRKGGSKLKKQSMEVIYYLCHIVLIACMWGEIAFVKNMMWAVEILKEWLISTLRPTKEQNTEVYVEVLLCLSLLEQQHLIESDWSTLFIPEFDDMDFHEKYHTAVLYALLFASQIQRRKVAILFLAHDQVQNHKLWVEWRDRLGETASCLEFFVCDSGNTQVFERGRWIRIPTNVTTSWNDVSLVTAHLESLKFIIDTDRFIQSIFLVSGYDIPILPARNILSIDITKSIVFFQRMSDIYRSSNNTLKQHNNLQIGAQWMCTTRALSQFLYQYDYKHLINIREQITEKYGMMIQVSPDQYLLQTAIAQTEHPIINMAITSQEKEHSTDFSPIVWESLVIKRSVEGDEVLSLRDALQIAREEGALFFRKIKTLSTIQTELLLCFIHKQLEFCAVFE